RSLSADDAHDLIRFNECMDVALTESVSEFVGRVNRSRELLLGILGHDLRDPLSAIIMSADLLLELPPDASLSRDLSRRIRGIGQRLQRMVADLLDFTRGRFGGGIPVERQATDLRDVVRLVADEVSTANPDRPVHVEVTGDLRGAWDPTRIGQALSNLLGN